MKLTEKGLLIHFSGYTYSMETEIESNHLDSIIILTTGEEVTGQQFLNRYFYPEQEYDKSNDEPDGYY
jgi:hypothetical protein